MPDIPDMMFVSSAGVSSAMLHAEVTLDEDRRIVSVNLETGASPYKSSCMRCSSDKELELRLGLIHIIKSHTCNHNRTLSN